MENNHLIQPKGKIGIFYLKEIWLHFMKIKQAISSPKRLEWKYINAVFNTLGIGLEPTIRFLLQSSPSFEEFEQWIEKNGVISNDLINHFNAIINNQDQFSQVEKVLTEADLEQWNRDGYLIIKQTITKEDCQETVNLICQEIGANLSDPKSWYKHSSLKQGIMVQLFKSAILDKNRLSKKIRLVYQELWNSNNLIVSMDRVSFNPPETDNYQFPGPNLHWDVSLKSPIPLGIQGLLYLTDTDENQGAFTLIPGFHTKIESWLKSLDKAINPRDKKLLDDFEKKPIAGNAGDFIIWNHCLPHGSRPNTSTKPRIVQYINYQPIDLKYQDEWI